MAKKKQGIHQIIPHGKKTWITITLTIILIGCSQYPPQLALKHFEQNELLNSAEKSFASKFLLFMYKNYEREGIIITPKELNSQNYKKWGIGPFREFHRAEMAYINEIDNMVDIWQIYNNINLNNLSLSEQTYLKAVHDKYGSNPSIDDLTTIDMRGFFPEETELYDMVFEMVEFVFDLHKVDDFVIIFLHRLEHKAII